MPLQPGLFVWDPMSVASSDAHFSCWIAFVIPHRLSRTRRASHLGLQFSRLPSDEVRAVAAPLLPRSPRRDKEKTTMKHARSILVTTRHATVVLCTMLVLLAAVSAQKHVPTKKMQSPCAVSNTACPVPKTVMATCGCVLYSSSIPCGGYVGNDLSCPSLGSAITLTMTITAGCSTGWSKNSRLKPSAGVQYRYRRRPSLDHHGTSGTSSGIG